MAELNKVMLIGRLTKDPELRYTPAGMAVARLRMAVNHTYRGKDDKEKKEEVLFIDVSYFGRTAETVKQYLSKGRELFVEGRLQMNDWTDKQGQKRRDYAVVGDRFQFLGGGQRTGARDGAAEESESAPADTFEGGEPAARPEAPSAQKEDDLPF